MTKNILPVVKEVFFDYRVVVQGCLDFFLGLPTSAGIDVQLLVVCMASGFQYS